MKTYLVIGGAGFIGSHLCEHLIKTDKVISLDNYFTGSINNHIKGVEYITGEAKYINELIKDNIDCVFHFGEYSRVEQSYDDIQKTFELNQQLLPVLEFCRKNCAKLIYSGSSTKFAHGDIQGKYQSPYAWTKATNTDLILSYSEWFDIDFAIVYFYNVYGPREIKHGKYATLIAKFFNLTEQKLPLTVVSPGTQKRNFTHVYDIISGLELVSKYGAGDGFGIGSDDSYTIFDVANAFNGKIELLPERKGNRLDAEIITDKIKELGWKSKYNLITYIKGELNET